MPVRRQLLAGCLNEVRAVDLVRNWIAGSLQFVKSPTWLQAIHLLQCFPQLRVDLMPQVEIGRANAERRQE